MEKEVLRLACLQTELNEASRKLFVDIVTHLVTAHLLQLILMQGSKLAGARNKSDLWPKYVAWHANRTTAWRRVGSGAPTAVQDALRTPPAPSWNCGLQFGSLAGKICGYKVPGSTRLQFGRGAK